MGLRTLKTFCEKELDPPMTPEEVCERADVSLSTFYKMNRQEDVYLSTAIKVFNAIGMTLEQYRHLDRCPRAGEFDRGQGQGKHKQRGKHGHG